MKKNNLRKLSKAMATAEDYSSWRFAAEQHDIVSNVISWKQADTSRHFDYKSIRRRLDQLTGMLDEEDSKGLLFALNEGIHGNMDGMGNERLYERAKFGTKDLIVDYISAIRQSLQYLASDTVRDISFEEKLDFFRRAHHCYGSSAFLMSGSGAFLYFHLGVVKALWAEGILPKVISGSSGGAAVGAMICTHADDEIPQYFTADTLTGTGAAEDDERNPIARITNPKHMSIEMVQARIAELIPDMTFQEAFELTGRHLNISIAPAEQHQASRLLNAITSPNVFIRDAVLASCALPGVYPPVQLSAKDSHGERVPYLPDRKWVDGSVTNDLPTKRLARLYGANHFIVSLANPLVLPFATDVKQKSGSVAAILDATTKSSKAWLNAYASIIDRPMSMVPPVHSMANIALSVINQNYTGDINIVRPQLNWSLPKMLSDLLAEEIDFLMDMGERTAWPKVEQVRNQTVIGRELEQILSEYEDRLVDGYEHASALKKKIA